MNRVVYLCICVFVYLYLYLRICICTIVCDIEDSVSERMKEVKLEADENFDKKCDGGSVERMGKQ